MYVNLKLWPIDMNVAVTNERSHRLRVMFRLRDKSKKKEWKKPKFVGI